MRIGPFELARVKTKASGGQLVTSWPLPTSANWWPVLREGFSGAWQRMITVPVQDANTHPTWWACVTLIAADIAKCRPRLMSEGKDGISTEVDVAAYSPVIRKPNHYQNRIQFYLYWVICLLTRGNAYALKERDGKGNIIGLYLLEPTRVRPMVGPSGDVYYAVGQDVLSGVTEASITIPAREIIHHPINTLYHPLVGLSPVYAAGHAALQALTIVNNATKLFKRGSLVGGVLTAPGTISDEVASRLEAYWNANYAGEENIGKVAVLGDGLKFEKPTVMSAVDAQLIDQLKWDDEKICATLHVPPYMVCVGPLPSYNNVDALVQQYFGQTLQILFEGIELCLTEGLELKQEPNGTWYEVEFDIEALDRMDSTQRMEVATKGVTGGVWSPNEARQKFNLPPVKGGDTPYLQVQNYSLAALDARDKVGPPVTPGLQSPSAPEPAKLPAAPVEPAPPKKDLEDFDEAVVMAEIIRSLKVAA